MGEETSDKSEYRVSPHMALLLARAPEISPHLLLGVGDVVGAAGGTLFSVESPWGMG